MHQISSSWTLFNRIFFPTFFLVFFGVGNLAFWFVNFENYMMSNLLFYRVLFMAMFLVGLIVFYNTSWKLKRIDIDDEFVYVSNYFKTARYSFDMIETIKEKMSFTNNKSVYITLVLPGTFGQVIRFKPDKIRYEKFFKSNPHLTGKYSV